MTCTQLYFQGFFCFVLFFKFKAILRDVMGGEKFYFLLFFIIHLFNDTGCRRIVTLEGIRAVYFA